MEEKIENNGKKKSQKKRILFLVILLLLLLIPALIFWGKNGDENKSSESGDMNSNQASLDEGDEDVNEDKNGEEQRKSEEAEAISEEEMTSENYRVSQVKFGGNAVIENGRTRDAKLEIYQVKSETIISQEDNEPRILISWKTNKEAISRVDYAKSDGRNAVNASEEGYGFEHSMLIKNMEFSTIYTYRIEAKDKWGNKVNTEYFSAYTGDKSESIFDLITNAVEDVFGWAM